MLCSVLSILSLSKDAYAATRPDTAKLTVLYTNDVHGHLFPFDYEELGTQLTNVGGAARRATLIRRIKTETHNPVLVMDAGDLFTRGPLDTLNGSPDFAVINAVPYDVMTFGNNEFKASAGPESVQILEERIKEAKFAIVSANVFDAATGKRLVPPYKIFDLDGLKVAVLGLLTTRDQQNPQYAGLRVDDPIATAKLIVPELRKQADIVIALTHLGVARDLELASSVPDIDVIVGGDTHTWLYQPLITPRKKGSPDWAVGTLICQDGEWGRALGKLDLTLRSTRANGYAVASYNARLVEVNSTIEPAPDVTALLEKAAAPYTKEIGKLKVAIKLRDAADWVAARMREAAGSQIGVEPRDEVDQGLKTGKVTALDIRSMFPFVNQVDKITLTGKQLASYIASQPDMGLSGARLVKGVLFIGNQKLRDSQTYTVAIEEYYAKHTPLFSASPCIPLGKTNVEIVTQYISSHK